MSTQTGSIDVGLLNKSAGYTQAQLEMKVSSVPIYYYELTTDTAIDTSKTYYVRSGTSPNYVYTEVTNPVVADIGTYYERFTSYQTDLVSNINAIADRINLLADYISFSPTSGTSVLNEIEALKNAVVIDTSVPSVSIGDTSKMHVVITDERLSFYEGSQEVAYINGQRLYITQSVVLDEMQLGNDKWAWKYDGRDDSIFLKWIG